jgi:hypothetical protein
VAVNIGSSNQGEKIMCTIFVASGVSVHGCFVKTLPNGLTVVRVGKKEYVGTLITSERYEKRLAG